MQNKNMKNLLNFFLVPLLLVILLQILSIHAEVGTAKTSTFVKRDNYESPFPSRQNRRYSAYRESQAKDVLNNRFNSRLFKRQNEFQESAMEPEEIIDESWARLLQEAKEKEPAFKDPVDISKLNSAVREDFKKHILKSDIVKIGTVGKGHIFADLTNGIGKITPKHPLYQDYYKVVEEREVQRKKPRKEIAEILASSFVTIHPRTNTLFNTKKAPIYQQADSHYAIEASHPHYHIYIERYNENTIEWHKLMAQIFDHEINDRLQVSIFDKRRKLIDFATTDSWEGPKTPDDFEYPVLERIFSEQKREIQQIDELVSKGAQVVRAPSSTKEKPAYEVKGFHVNPIPSSHRIFHHVDRIYKNQEIKTHEDLSTEELSEKVRVQLCGVKKNFNLCVEGEQTFQVDRYTPNFSTYWKVYLKSQQDEREQEKVEEIVLHDVEERPQAVEGKKIYYDTYLNELIGFDHPHYKFYIDAAKRQQEQNELNKENCLHELEYCDISVIGNDDKAFKDRTKNKIIQVDDDEFINYKRFWEKKKLETNSIYHEFGSPKFLEELRLLPQKVGLPGIEHGSGKANPGTTKWKIYRAKLLSQRKEKRASDEEWERMAEASLRQESQRR